MFEQVLTVEEQRFRPDEWGMPGFEDRHIRGPLIYSGTVKSVDSFFFGDCIDSDAELFRYCFRRPPNILLLTVQFNKTDKMPPSANTIRQIVTVLKIPVVMFWFDIHALKISSLFQEYSSAATLNILFDSSSTSHSAMNFANINYVYAGLTFKEDLFNAVVSTQDIDVGVYGTIYSDRQEYINVLRSEGLTVTTAGGIFLNGQRSQVREDGSPLWVPYSIYLDLMRRTKIVLNSAFVSDLKYQMKGRVFEALWCSSFLLEQDNPVTCKYFTPGVDYATFTDTKDLVSKVKEYLVYKESRDRIRLQGRKTIEKYYNTKRFWGNLFETVESIRSVGLVCRGEIWNKAYFDAK